MTFYYEQIYGSTKIGGGYIDLKGTQIENLPIPNIPLNQQQPNYRPCESGAFCQTSECTSGYGGIRAGDRQVGV